MTKHHEKSYNNNKKGKKSANSLNIFVYIGKYTMRLHLNFSIPMVPLIQCCAAVGILICLILEQIYISQRKRYYN